MSHHFGQLLVVGLVMLVALLDSGQSQDGLRFPNLFGGLTNFFRQATQQQSQSHQQQQQQNRPVNGGGGQLSPGGTTFPFLQAPPPAFVQPQQPPPLQQQQAPVFFASPPQGGAQQQQQPLFLQQPQPGIFTPSIPFQPSQQQQQQQQQPWPSSNNNLVPIPPISLIPIGNIPLQNSPQTKPLAPIPAQFALSGNTQQQQQSQSQSERQGKSLLKKNNNNKPDALLLTSSASSSGTKEDKNVIDCGSGNDVGFCAVSEKYPRQAVQDMMQLHRCHEIVRQMYAEVPEDLDLLGDSHRRADTDDVTAKPSKPWSWSTYRKESACDSELRFIEPQVAQDRTGRWRVIVQTDDFPQRVAIDVCRNVDGVCKVLTDCGRKSRCVQRYSFQPLISLDAQQIDDEEHSNGNHLPDCPSMAIFRFPTSCVCHVEVEKVTVQRRNNNSQ